MIAQGKMGEVDWIITDDGELIIGKEGETQTFEYASSRIDSSWGWNSFRERILSISFKGQVNGNGSHSSMFEDCKSLTSLDLSNFNTSNVTSMADMFYYCEKLISLDLNNFNTSGVTNMTGMFDHCQLLASLDLSSFNTSSVTNMDSVFHYCKKLETIYVSSLWNINQVYSSIKMFSNCLKIVGLYETTYDSSKVDKTYARIDSSSQKGYLSSYIEKGVYDNVDWLIDSRYRLFIGKTGEEQTFINRDRRNAYDWPWYESYSINITSISFSGLVNGNGSHAYMFYNCQLLTSLDLSNFDTSNITSMKGMFSDCCSLTSLDFSGFDTSSVTDMSYMFYHCYVLAPLNLSKFDTPNVTSMNSMFYYCSLLTSLDLSNFNTEKVTDMNFMFSYCERLTTLDVSYFDTSSVIAMRYMFSNCNRLSSLNLSNFNTSSVTDMKYMFNNCESLTSLDLSSFNISNVTDMKYMFYNCPASINIFYVSNCSTQQGGAEDIDVTDIFTNSGEIFLMRPENVTNPTGVKDFWREVAATNSKVHFEYDDTSAPMMTLRTQRGKFESKEEEGVTTTIFVEDDAGGDVIKITLNIDIKQDNTPDYTEVGYNTLTSVVAILNNGDYTNFTKLKLNEEGFNSDADFIQYILNEGSFCIKLNDAPESQYLLELDICDRREDPTFPFKIIIPGVFAMIEFRKGGHGMSIGKICERDGLEVSIPTTIGEGLTLPTTLNGDVDLTKDQLVIGRYNILDANKAFIIGNGEADSEGIVSPSNALTVDWQGNIDIASGAKYKINGINLSASDVSALPISGGTLTGDLTIEDSTQIHKVIDLDSTTHPSSALYPKLIELQDVNGLSIGYVEGTLSTDGKTGISLTAKKMVSDVAKYNYLRLLVDDSGNPVVQVGNSAAWRTGLGLGSLATKSSVAPTTLLKTGSATYSNKITTATTLTIDVPCAADTGYKPIGITGVYATGEGVGAAFLRGYTCVSLPAGPTSFTVHTYWRTISNTDIAANTMKVVVQFMTMKTSLS